MKRYKFQILIAALICTGIASSYYSYLLGVTAAHEASIASILPIVQKQYQCITSSDQECIRIANETLLKVSHISAKSLLNDGLGVNREIEKTIEAFDEWYRSLKNTKGLHLTK